MQDTYNPMTDAYRTDPTATYCGPRLVVLSLMQLLDGAMPDGLTRDDCLTIRDILREATEQAGEDEQHAPDCMIWQIDAAADRGDGFPEPEDVACTCGLAERRTENLGARFTISGGEVIQIDPTEASDEEIPF